MPITESQRVRRQKHIGSSDMAAILGLDPYRSAYDVWLEKTGKVEDDAEKPHQRAGNLMELALLQYAKDELGNLRRNQYRSNPELHLGANIDAIRLAPEEPIEAKKQGAYSHEEFGEPGTDQVPDRVIIQSHVHMLCMNGSSPEVCHVVHYHPFKEFSLYPVPREPRIIEVIAEKAIEFWDQNVQGDTPPPDAKPSLEVIRRARREPGKVAPADPNLIAEYQQVCEQAKEAEKRKKELQAQILASDPEAEAFDFGDATYWLTYFEQSRQNVDGKSLKKHHPDIYQQFASTTTFRVLRQTKKPKNGAN